MTETLIGFELAKLSKEKKFEQYTGLFYENSSKINNAILARPNSYFGSDYRIIKCSQNLLQRWLREVHNIHICIDISINSKWFYNIYNLKDKRNCEFKESVNKFEFNTYEQALEQGLIEALKLINNVD